MGRIRLSLRNLSVANGRVRKLERATGFEPATLSLGS